MKAGAMEGFEEGAAPLIIKRGAVHVHCLAELTGFSLLCPQEFNLFEQPFIVRVMAFMVKHVVGGQLKNLTGGLTEEKPEVEKNDAAAHGMTPEEFEQYQQQLEEEKKEREAQFAQKKAERATVRTHFREKYKLPKNENDETQIQQAGDDIELPQELAKMIAEDGQEEAQKQSVLGQLSNIQNVDIDQLKDKAQATLEDLKKQTENCSLM
uniref:Uncharacterized protein n=1 Tax=Knipowitschia caucasica TaxID=637954 RepID=A0AAV2LUX2_KNICA